MNKNRWWIVEIYDENEPDAFEIIWATSAKRAEQKALEMGLEVLYAHELEEQ